MPIEFDRDRVHPEEPISRLVWQGNRRNSPIRADGSIRPRAFTPRYDLPRAELSTVRFVGLDRAEAIELGRLFADRARKELAGQIVVDAHHFSDNGLNFDPDNLPFERHLNVVDWPEKADDMAIEIVLSKIATYEDLEVPAPPGG